MTTRPKGSSFESKENFNFVSILDTGAVLDGVTDNTAAITLAQSYGLPVYVPPGTCYTGAFTATVPFFGAGKQSVLKCKAAALTSFITVSSGVTLKDLLLDGNKANQVGSNNHGLYLNGVSGVSISGVTIQNTLGDGINITNTSYDCQVSKVNITGFVKSGITVENAYDIDLVDCRCYNSDVTAFPGDGITLAPTAAGNSVVGVRVINGYSDTNVGRGFSAVGSGSKNVYDCIVDSFYAKGNTSHGIHLLTVQGILVRGVVKSNAGDGFRLEGDVQQCTVAGIADSNTGYGCREIVSGSTPNYNTLIAVKAVANTASNTVTKVGANSTILV